jgi:hypothetical protein
MTYCIDASHFLAYTLLQPYLREEITVILKRDFFKAGIPEFY